MTGQLTDRNSRGILCIFSILLMILGLVSVAQTATFELINKVRIAGRIVGTKKDEVFIVNERNLFVIEKSVIATISDGDSATAVSALKPSKSLRINYDAFENIIDINQSNVWSYDDYPKIVRHTGDLNPPEPPFQRPPDPTLKKKWYVTIKPVRLIWRCADITVARRMIFRHGEVRLSYFYSRNVMPFGATGEADIFFFGSILKNVNVLSGSLRYYYNPDGRGPFVGIGGSYANFTYTNDFWAKVFSWPPLSFRAPCKFEGGLIEIGITGTLFNFLVSSPSVSLGIGQVSYQINGKWYNDKKVNWIPTFNWTLGILF
ncbi:MAG: hypothetical protein WCY30_08345 [Candidatus Neomarinimicrobiota bacterium]